MFPDHFNILVECISWQSFKDSSVPQQRIKMPCWRNEAVIPCGTLTRAELLSSEQTQNLSGGGRCESILLCLFIKFRCRNEMEGICEDSQLTVSKKSGEFLHTWHFWSKMIKLWELKMKWSSSVNISFHSFSFGSVVSLVDHGILVHIW